MACLSAHMLRRNRLEGGRSTMKEDQEMGKWGSKRRTETEVDWVSSCSLFRQSPECLPGKPDQNQFWSESPEEQDPCIRSMEWSHFQHLQWGWEAAWRWSTEGEMTLWQQSKGVGRQANHTGGCGGWPCSVLFSLRVSDSEAQQRDVGTSQVA